MILRNTAERWGVVSKTLHWLIVLLILGQGTVGLLMVEMRNSPDKIQVYALHKSFGLTILALALLRLSWRLAVGVPRPVAGTPAWQNRIARSTHALLYVLLLAIPLSGWLFNSAAGFPLQWFWIVNLPALVAQDQALRELAGTLHEWLFWGLVATASVHAAAALHHHLFLRDATLARMLPQGWLQDPSDPSPRDSRDAV